MEGKLEEILKRIIEIDNKAKEIAREEKEKKENIENILQSEVNTRKAILSTQYKEEMESKNRIYDELFEEKKREIDIDINNKKLEIDNFIRYNEDKIIKNIVTKIENGQK